MDWKKVILYSIIGISILAGSVILTNTITKRSYNKQLDEYRVTINSLGVKLKEQADTISSIEAINNRITDELGNVRLELAENTRRAKDAESAIGKISVGISGDIEDLQGIIEAIRSIRTALEEYGEEQEDMADSRDNSN